MDVTHQSDTLRFESTHGGGDDDFLSAQSPSPKDDRLSAQLLRETHSNANAKEQETEKNKGKQRAFSREPNGRLTRRTSRTSLERDTAAAAGGAVGAGPEVGGEEASDRSERSYNSSSRSSSRKRGVRVCRRRYKDKDKEPPPNSTLLSSSSESLSEFGSSPLES